MANCKECHTKLYFFSTKLKVGADLLCQSCYSNYIAKQKQDEADDLKRQEQARSDYDAIISKLVEKYVTKLVSTPDFPYIPRIKTWLYTLQGHYVDTKGFADLCECYDVKFDVAGNPFVNEDGVFRSLNALRCVISEDLKDRNALYNSGRSSVNYNLLKEVIEMLEHQLTFCDDLENLCKLAVREGVDSEYAATKLPQHCIDKCAEVETLLLIKNINRLYHKIDLLIPPDTERIPDVIIRKYVALRPSANIFLQGLPALLREYFVKVEKPALQELSLLLLRFHVVVDETLALQERLAKMQEDAQLDAFERKLEKPYKVRLGSIENLTGLEFEDYVKELFRCLGYEACKTAPTRDQGADIVLDRSGEKITVQLKKSSTPVGNAAIQEVVASKAFYSADGCMVVTNSTFTTSARELAKSNKVELWDGDKVRAVIKEIESDSVSGDLFEVGDVNRWYTREDVIKEWLSYYETFFLGEGPKVECMGFFNVIEDFMTPIGELVDRFKEVATMDNVVFDDLDAKDEKEKEIGALLVEVRGKFARLYHLRVEGVVIPVGLGEDGTGELEEEILSHALDIYATFGEALANLGHMICWESDPDFFRIDLDFLRERVERVKRLMEKRLPDLMNRITSKLGLIGKEAAKWGLRSGEDRE